MVAKIAFTYKPTQTAVKPAQPHINRPEPDDSRNARKFSQELKESAIRDDMAALNTYYLEGDRAIGRFVEPVEMKGFTGKQQIDAQWRALRKKSQIRAIEAGALFFQGIDPLTDEQLSLIRCKPIKARIKWKKDDCTGKLYDTGKLIKYEQLAGQPTPITYFAVTREAWQRVADHYGLAMPTDIATSSDGAALGFWQWVQVHPQIELIITEGEKKALALLSAGYAAVSVPGVWNPTKGKKLHSDLLPFVGENRRFIIAFDQDEKQSTRDHVELATTRLATLLANANSMVFVAAWDGTQGKGIDDYIAAGGDVAQAIKSAKPPTSLGLLYARRNVEKRLGKYNPAKRVDLPCLSAVDAGLIPESGIVAIVSGLGTGKTKLINKITRNVDSAIAPGSRVSLQRGLTRRLGLTYIDDADKGNGYYLIDADGNPTKKIGLCWDSIRKATHLYSDGDFDLILDEADQGFKHLISGETCKKDGKRPLLVAHAKTLIKNAKRVILASGTLTRHELDLVAQLRNEKPWILENTYKANSYPITLYSGQAGVKYSSRDAQATVLAALRNGLKDDQRIICATDELRNTKAIELLGEKSGLMPHQILRFDRETSSEDLQRQFADNPDQFLERHDIRLLVHSPSLTSGVSIEGDHFDSCFAVFTGQAISPDDALQALARVRKPIPRIVYGSHWGNGNNSIDAARLGDFIKLTQQRSKAITNGLKDTPNIDLDSPTAQYHGATEVSRKWDMMRFGASLQALIENAGHALTVGVSSDELGEVASVWTWLQREVKDRHNRAIFQSPIISEIDADTLRSKANPNQEAALKLNRYDLANFYHIQHDELTLPDVQYDQNGKQRRRIARLECLLIDGLAYKKDRDDLSSLKFHNQPIQAHDLPARHLGDRTAQHLGIPELLAFCLENSWHSETTQVTEFTQKFRQNLGQMQAALGLRINPKEKDCAIVGKILKNYGVTTVSRNLGSDGKRCRVYTVDAESLECLKVILDKRAQTHADKGLQLRSHALNTLLFNHMYVPSESAKIDLELAPNPVWEMPKKTQFASPGRL